MCYSRCPYERWDGECTKRKSQEFATDAHCYEPPDDEVEEEELSP